jgi:hypothetical protein
MVMIDTAIPTTVFRVWDLKPGDSFRGRTIAHIYGVVGLAHSPVAIISFSEASPGHTMRITATHSDTPSGSDTTLLHARDWIRHHELQEGDVISLGRLRAGVLAATAG